MNLIKKNSHKVQIEARTNCSYFFFACVFRILLDVVYKDILCRVFAYTGYTDRSSISFTIVSWIVFMVFLLACKNYYINNQENMLSEVLFLLFVLYVVPFTVMIHYGCYTYDFIFANSIYLLLLFLIPRIHVKRVLKISFLKNDLQKRTLGEVGIGVICVISCLIVLFVSGIYTGFRFNFNFSLVYELRSEASTYSLPTILVYLYSWTRGIMTILIAYYMLQKKYFFVVVCSLIQMLSFGIDGQRTVFFYVIVAIGVSLLPNYTAKCLNKIIICFFPSMVLLAEVIYRLFGNIMIVSLFIRRTMFSPQILSSCYFNYFNTHIPDFFRGSILKHLGFSTPYPQLPHIIATEYFNSPDTNSNNGLISDAMANLGYFGIIIFPVIIIVTLKIIDSASSNLDNRLYIVVSLYICLTLINSFYFTAMVTHGLFIIIIIIKLMRRKETDIY